MGSVDEAAETFGVLWCRVLAPGLGVTTGKIVARLPGGVTVVPGSPGKVTGGSGGSVVGAGIGLPTWVVIVASAGESPSPVTVTVTVICSPEVAVAPILSLTCSSIAWLAGSEPIEQVVRCATGHNVNLGRPTALPWLATLAVTWRARTVLQAQNAYLIVPPGAFCDCCRRISAVTQITPGLGDGLGEWERVGLGVGDGVVLVVEDGLGLRDVELLEVGLGLWEVELLVVGLALEVALAVGDGRRVWAFLLSLVTDSRTARTTAVEAGPHGDPRAPASVTLSGAASAGAMAGDSVSNPPAVTTATCTARTSTVGTAPLSSRVLCAAGRSHYPYEAAFCPFALATGRIGPQRLTWPPAESVAPRRSCMLA
jgi:hypothetical protein